MLQAEGMYWRCGDTVVVKNDLQRVSADHVGDLASLYYRYTLLDVQNLLVLKKNIKGGL